MVKIKEPLKYKCKKPNFGLITEDGSLITYAKIECMLEKPTGLTLSNKHKVIGNCIPAKYVKGIPEEIISKREIEEIAKKLYDENEKERMENDIKVILEVLRPSPKIINKLFKNLDKEIKYWKFVKISPLNKEEFNIMLTYLNLNELVSEEVYKLYLLVLKHIFVPEKWKKAFLEENMIIKPEFYFIDVELATKLNEIFNESKETENKM